MTSAADSGPEHPDELEQLCADIRDRRHRVGEADVERAESLTAELNAVASSMPGLPTPPPDVAQRLSLAGWFDYEVSWALVQQVDSDWSGRTGARHERSAANVKLLERVADAAGALPWPEWAPRALGAFRAHALAASKENTQDGYDRAWLLHRKAREKYADFRNQVLYDDDLVWALDQVLVQLALAETGTACREPELVVATWPADGHDEDAVFLRIYETLRRGVASGREAIDRITALDRDRPLGRRVDARNLLTPVNFRNPGIMTARAQLIMLPMTMLMEEWGLPASDNGSWDDDRRTLLEGTLAAYEVIEKDLADTPFDNLDHQRSVLQIRINLAFVSPGLELPSRLTFADCLQHTSLDATAIEAMSTWLASWDGQLRPNEPNLRRNGDANIIGSAVMPTYLASLRALQGPDGWAEYLAWRRRWLALDRAATRPGRRDGFEAAVRRAETII